MQAADACSDSAAGFYGLGKLIPAESTSVLSCLGALPANVDVTVVVCRLDDLMGYLHDVVCAVVVICEVSTCVGELSTLEMAPLYLLKSDSTL